MSIKLLFIFLLLSIQSINNLKVDFDLKEIETFSKEELITDTKEKEFDDSITDKDVVDQIGLGYNLGCTFESTGGKGINSETSWGNPLTTEQMINGIAKKGFKSIRIPITWHNHIIDEKYTIDPKWMKRIKTVVDWCIGNGLYVIIGTFHDNAAYSADPIKYNEGYYLLKKDMEESMKFIYNVYKQITIAFNNGYDHHLIFESFNEPRLKGHEYEWKFKAGVEICEEACEVLNEYNKFIVKIIRESGGNNEKRFIMIPSVATGYDSAINSKFVFPDDSKYNSKTKILFSLHMYRPYDFTMSKDLTLNVFKEEYKDMLFNNLKNLHDKLSEYGHYLIVGEFGARDKNNAEERIKWGEYYIKTAKKFGFPCLLWDNGSFKKNYDDIGSFYGQFHRSELTWEWDELIDAYIKAAKK